MIILVIIPLSICSLRERTVQKRAQEILNNLYQGFTTVSLDESFFFFDSLIRKVWIEENSGPIITLTCSHGYFCIFGAIGLDRKSSFANMINLMRIHFMNF
jgi:hypothetical protein